MSQASTLQSKRALYVGGVDTAVKLDTLRAAFIPFGPIHHIEMPMDYEKGVHKGFAFIEFQDAGKLATIVYPERKILISPLTTCLKQIRYPVRRRIRSHL